MVLDTERTIVAIASANGSSKRGIVRMSGPETCQILDTCFQASPASVSTDLTITQLTRPTVLAGKLSVTPTGQSIPIELMIWPDQRSYTKQPTAEIHTFGSIPLLDGIVRTLCESGCKVAEPGEFTMRAFLAGRIDLTQAEAVLGVIDASGRDEVEIALTQLAGGVRTHLSALRMQLIELLAHLEAGLDFVEEDIEFISQQQLNDQLTEILSFIQIVSQQTEQRNIISRGMRIVLIGEPNVGKSSLFNLLTTTTESESALVSNIPGTTRDYLTKTISMDGLECTFIDTAGKEFQTTGPSLAAQKHQQQQNEQSNLTLLCIDSTRLLSVWEQEQLEKSDDNRLVVLTKCDQRKTTDLQSNAIDTSAVHHSGMDSLWEAIRILAEQAPSKEGAIVHSTATRCRESLRLAAISLEQAIEANQFEYGEELVAAEIRVSLDELGKVIGAVYTDDILDVIFSRFCIGK